jgi:CheY-like chemotaxis protein
MKILLAEDSAVIRMIVGQMLRSMGMEVIQANDGEEALERFSEHVFDLALMDVDMPVCDGMEATRRIRALEARSGAPSMPILAITGSSSSEDRQRLHASGMSDVLGKPFTREQLERSLQMWQERMDASC